jgi:hypothetical protein
MAALPMPLASLFKALGCAPTTNRVFCFEELKSHSSPTFHWYKVESHAFIVIIVLMATVSFEQYR